MEEVTMNSAYEITKKKIDHYGYDTNFAGASELLVTITLEEYRDLVATKYKDQVNTIQKEKWKVDEKVRELEEQVKALKALVGKENGDDGE